MSMQYIADMQRTRVDVGVLKAETLTNWRVMSSGSKKVSGMNSGPIGQVPSNNAGRQVQIGSSVIGAIPTASSGAASRMGIPASVISKRPALFVPKLSQQAAAIRDTAQASVVKTAKTTELKDNRTPFLKSQVAEPRDKGPAPPSSSQGTRTHPKAPAHTIRSAAGETWQDPTLADWDPSMSSFHYSALLMVNG